MRMRTLALLSCLLAPGLAMADIAAIQSVTGGTLFTAGDNQLYGNILHVNTAINLTALGIYDAGSAGLAQAHDVGIYDRSTQSLIASVTLNAGACPVTVDSFCYATLGAPILLGVGDYVTVMTMPNQTPDLQFGNASAIGTAPEITYLTSAFDVGATLHFPDPFLNGSFAEGFAGPNFLFTDGAAAVPEPASLILLASIGGLIGMQIRRRSAKR